MTTRRLVLIRHAKAATGTSDVRRPLAPRGVRDAAAIGAWLAALPLLPDRVVASPALRAVQTWECAVAALTGVPPAEDDDRIYDNTVDALLSVIRGTAEDVRTLALIGHNPAMAALADVLDDGTGDASARGHLAGGYPTGGVAVFTVAGLWSELDPHRATLTHFAAPRG